MWQWGWKKPILLNIKTKGERWIAEWKQRPIWGKCCKGKINCFLGMKLPRRNRGCFMTRLSDFTLTFHFHALEKEMATHSSDLAWRIPGTEEPGGLLSMGSHRVGHDWSDLAVAAVMSFDFQHAKQLASSVLTTFLQVIQLSLLNNISPKEISCSLYNVN